MKIKSQGSSGRGHSMYLLVLLCFLPLLALNLAISFLGGIDHHWKKQEQKELAQQEVEALSAGADFSFQFARKTGDFIESFKALIDAGIKPAQLVKNLQQRSEGIFRSPFPDYELFVFKVPDDNSSTDILFMRTDSRPSKRAFCKAFEHLVRVNRGEKMTGDLQRQNDAMVTGILGGEVKSDAMALSQRGRPTFAFYRFFPHWFMWDYFEVKGKGTYGMFLFTRSDESRKFSAKLLALRDLREQHLGYGAFIPLLSGFGGAVYQSPLQKSRILKEWVKDKVSLVESDLKKWLHEGSPPVSQLGKYLAFSYLGKGQSHLAVLLIPAIQQPERPVWLFFVNIFVGGSLLLLMLRGAILGVWPNINLRLRFILTYLLAATLPVSMLLISAYGYVVQFRRSIHFQAVSQLQFCIKQFDSRKAQILDEYKSAFSEVVGDEKLHALLKKHGSNSIEARDRIVSIFSDRPQPLPLLSFAIMDEVGDGARYFGGHSQAEAEPTFEAFKYPVVSVLRNKMLQADPGLMLKEFKPTAAQTTSLEAYKSMSGLDLIEEIDKRRSFAITRQVGATTATQMHELIKFDGRDRYAIFIVWDDQALDVKTFRHSVDYFGLNNPGFLFTAYRVTPQGLNYLYKPDRHIGADFLERSLSLAELASFRDSYAGARYENLSLIAMPSKKYHKTIIAGGTQHFELEQSVSYRLMALGLVLCLALIVVLWCSYLSARLFLDPITGLKSALDKVAAGHLDIEITSSSSDELGQLCQEFTSMAHGLREREKLATLISDHAIEAISRAGDGRSTSDTDSFEGVALVSDIRNFTGMCEQYDPDVITDLLNEHFAQMTRIISEHGGRIYKYIGDAIEAVFPEDHGAAVPAAERAFNAASLMIVRLLQINRQRVKNNLFKYQIGVGLAYGKMFAGSIGSVETRLDFAIVGEPVKRAASLEACSVKNPAFPLVIDEAVAGCLQHKGLKFEPVTDKDDNGAFILSEIGGLPDASVSESSGRELEYRPENSFADKTDFKRFEAGRGSGLSEFSAFVAGAVFIILIVTGLILGSQILKDSQLNSIKVEMSAENIRLIEQIKCESAEQIAFENVCRKILLDFEGLINHGNEESSLAKHFEQRIMALEPAAGQPSRVAVLMFSQLEKANEFLFEARTLYSMGFTEPVLQKLAVLASFRRSRERKDWKTGIDELPDSLSRDLFGEQIANSMFLLEFFGRTAEVKMEGQAEYFFYDFLTDANDQISGILMLSAPVKNLKHSLPLLLSGYAKDGQFIAINKPANQQVYSVDFPADLREKLSNGWANTAGLAGRYVINEDSVTVNGKPHGLMLVQMVDRGRSWSDGLARSGAVVAGLLLIMFWYRVVAGNSRVNRSVAAKLWFALLVAAVTPLITVFLVSGLYLSEDFNARMSQEKGDLQRFIDLFELRDSFATPLGWKMVNDWTYAPATRKLMEKINQASGSAEVEPLKALLKGMTDSWHIKVSLLDKNVFNFFLKDIAAAGKSGWDFASSGYQQNKTTQFGMMLQQIAKNLANRRNHQGMRGVAGEIAVETGLQTVRSLFGDDVYIKLSHGLGLPVVMNVLSGTAGIIIYPVPSIDKVDFIMVWMVMFDFEGYLGRIAKNYEGSYKVFPVEMHRYGTIVDGGNSKFRQELTAAASMIMSSNLPVSLKVKHNGQLWRLEGRPGITQLTSMIVAMTPEAPIHGAIEQNRFLFNALLLLSLILILVIARNIAADILEPITSLMNGMKQAGRENYGYRLKIDRADELGALCGSFDTMMKGLEEKMLMGRMLSKSALKVSLKDHDQESRKAEYVFVYIGIPDFSTWIKGMSAEQLIGDLKNHVASLARIIIDQGGDIDKIIGDKILAVFSADRDRKGAVAAAFRAATEIIKAENQSLLPFPVALGLNYGEVITGFLGVGEKRDYTVIGDAVNVTARIEGQAEKLRFGRCLISQNVFELASRDFTAREFGEVELKGKSLPLKIYQLTI